MYVCMYVCKVFPIPALNKHHAMTIYWECRYNPTILDPGIRWKWVVSFMPLPLYHWENVPKNPQDRILGKPRSSSREAKNFKPCRESNPNHPASGPSHNIYIMRLNRKWQPGWNCSKYKFQHKHEFNTFLIRTGQFNLSRCLTITTLNCPLCIKPKFLWINAHRNTSCPSKPNLV
jgi:hypothetical protein